MVYKKQTKFGFVGRNSCPGAKGWNPRNKKFRIAILVAGDWGVLSMQTMTWLASRTSSAYSNSATKASFDPLSVICADSTRTYNLPFHKTASQPAALLSSLPVVKLAFACVSEITRGRPLQFLTRKRSLKVDLVLGSNAWLAGSEGFRCSPTPVPSGKSQLEWATSGAPFGHAAQRNTHLRGLASLSHGTLVGSRGTITTHG